MSGFGVQLLVGVIFLALMIGYGWGRRHGRRDGFIEGLRFAPLEMRRSSLEKGGCVICGTAAAPCPPVASDADTPRSELP